jgi:hypothetical protein
MANTITQRTVIGGGSDRNIYRLINIVSDGTEETDLVVYDNSSLVNDVTKGSVAQVWMSGDSCNVRLEWDQTTDSPVISADPASNLHFDYRCFGGITNPNGTGATGDLLLSTADLDAGDEVTILIHILQ